MLVKTGRIASLGYIVYSAITDIKFHLNKNDVAADNANAVLADFTEADFDGYGEKTAVTFPTPTINTDGAAETLSPTLTWTAGGAISGAQTIYGIYATITPQTGGADVLLWYDRFAASITLVNPGELVEKKVKFLDTNYAP